MTSRDSNVLVMGGSGFIGSNYIARSIHLGLNVQSVPRISRKELIAWGKAKPTSTLVCVAGSVPQGKLGSNAELYRNNIDIALDALSLAEAINCEMLVYLSTFLYHGKTNTPLGEDDPVWLSNAYRASKHLAEEILWRGTQLGETRFVGLRPSNIYGPGQNPKMLIGSLLRGASAGKMILDHPHPIRDYLHVYDLCDAINRAVELGNVIESGIFNVGSGEVKSNLEVAELISEQSRTPVELVVKNQRRNLDLENGRINSEKFKSKTGWIPRYNLEDYIRENIKCEI